MMMSYKSSFSKDKWRSGGLPAPVEGQQLPPGGSREGAQESQQVHRTGEKNISDIVASFMVNSAT